MRLPNIDFLKGFLIILVIAGHILQGTFSDNFLRYAIYSFHMPLFVGISGFLFNYLQSRNLSFLQLAGKYFFRVIVPWFVALVVYTIAIEHGKFTPGSLAKSFLLPYYHLWFIPAFLSWIFLSWLFSKARITVERVLIISAVISVATFVLNSYPEWYRHSRGAFAINMLLYTFRPFFFVFFVVGYYLRAARPLRHPMFSPIMLAANAVAMVVLFFYPNKIATVPVFFLFNIALLNWVVEKARNNGFMRSQIVEWIGINSLGIYLWHVLPLLALKSLLSTTSLTLFYAAAVAVEVIFIPLIYLLTKLGLVNKFLFGGDVIRRTPPGISSK